METQNISNLLKSLKMNFQNLQQKMVRYLQ